MTNNLQGKNIVLGVTGGIAAYKACTLVRLFKKQGANVDVIMTKNAAEFVSPLTFETLSNRPVVTDMFERGGHWEVEHISLAKKADLFVVAPATANIIGKYANGIADDMLSTTLLATTAPVVLCPAMNVNMYHSEAVNYNLHLLQLRGVYVVEAESGFLACGDNGEGRMAEPETIADACAALLCSKQDLVGKHVLVTCGATVEKLDDARFVSNFSSGKMGSAIVSAALERGATVTVVLGRHTASIDPRAEIVNVETTEQMLAEVLSRVEEQDIFVMAGAPCDYRPQTVSPTKLKGDVLQLSLVKNPDIAEQVGQRKGNRFLCVFAAETDNCVENALQKLRKKHADLAVVNDVKHNNVFGSDTNTVTFVTEQEQTALPEMSKRDVAHKILDRAVR